MSNVNIADKLVAIAQKEQQIVNTVRETNTLLEQVLYGTGEGGKSYYDKFWDDFQQNGTQNKYIMAFTTGWTADNFKPKYNIKPEGSAAYMFYANVITGLDLREDKFKEKYGIEIDLSSATNLTQFIAYSRVRYVGTVTAPVSTIGLQNMFANATNLLGISKIIIPTEVQTINTSGAFTNCTLLQEVYFDGYIPSSVSFQWCPLIKASIKNILEHLSPTATGQTLTLKKSAIDKAFETSEGANDGCASAEWRETITPYANDLEGNWTISVV